MNPSIKLPDMLRRLNVDAGQACELFAPLLERAATTCAVCPALGVCKAWLAGGGAPEDWRGFCPNARLIECLPKRRAHREEPKLVA